eukprot:COSAG02_NODE_567_length_20212_cov_18.927460_17_plen_368_part_00
MALVHGDPSLLMPEAERLELERLIATSCAEHGVGIHHGNPEYWKARYAASSECASGSGSGDWVCTFRAVAEAFATELQPAPRAKPPKILHVGCGDSEFAREMHIAGFTETLHTDFDEGVIDQQRRRSASLQWAVVNACDMSSCETASYDAVVDKGCLDIFLPILLGAATTEAEEERMLADAGRMLREVFRVLRPGGKYICISLHVHSALVLRACSGMEHCVRFGADGFARSHSGADDAALLAELRSALHSRSDTIGAVSGQRPPAFFHVCTKPGLSLDEKFPPMWSLSQYHVACKDLDRSLLAQQQPELLIVLLGLLGWCGLRLTGRSAEAALLISVLALVYGARVYMRTSFRADAARAGSKAWWYS